LGKDDGEFGGELLFLREFSQPQYLLRWPIAAIHRIGERVLVIPGRGHGVSQTMVFEVVSNESETPTLRRWKVLPGGHHGSGLNDRGELELSFNLGNFIVSQDGDIRMATD
jgi:hypothetical protein